MKLATIIIEKVASDDQTLFECSQDVDSNGNFVLTGGSSKIFLDVDPFGGPYTVTEEGDDNPNVDFDLVDLRCSDDDSTVDLANREATINVDPGELVTCTFTNVAEEGHGPPDDCQADRARRRHRLRLPAQLRHDLPFTLSDLEAETSRYTPDVIYKVTEDDPGPDYALTDIECLTTRTRFQMGI